MKRNLLLWMFMLPMFCALFGTGAKAQASNCSVDYSIIDFGGNINILSDQPITTEGYALVYCPALAPGITARVCVGMHPDTSPSRMQNDSDPSTFLNYGIFTDPEHTSPWLDPLKLRPYVDITYVQPSVKMDAYALMPSGQTGSTAGQYLDFVRPPFRYFIYATGDTPPSCDQQGYNRTPSYLTVVATITPNCTISATNMTFDPQTIITTDLLAQSALSVKCTNKAPYWVSLDNGQNFEKFGQRAMQSNAGNYIVYDLYSDSARTSRWGETKDMDTLPGKGTAAGQTLPVYGKIPKPTISPPAGTYTDRITATVNF